MSYLWDISHLRQAVEEYSELHQHLSHQPCVDLLRRCGPPGIQLVSGMLHEQVGTTDETIACYCIRLIIRSEMTGRVNLILHALELPFEKGVREEVWEMVFNDAIDYPEFLSDQRFLAASEKLASTWWNSQLDRFLEMARHQS